MQYIKLTKKVSYMLQKIQDVCIKSFLSNSTQQWEVYIIIVRCCMHSKNKTLLSYVRKNFLIFFFFQVVCIMNKRECFNQHFEKTLFGWRVKFFSNECKLKTYTKFFTNLASYNWLVLDALIKVIPHCFKDNIHILCHFPPRMGFNPPPPFPCLF